VPSLTLKNISDKLMDELREVTEQGHRSITLQVLYMLEQALTERKAEKARETVYQEEQRR
jgi:hypothetical protein